jgi:recombination protein RecA
MPIADALKILQKQMKEALEFDDKLEGITTGSTAVDYITGIGGFPRGRISEVFGWESSGKTTLCLSACAQAQRRGLVAAYIDMERAVDLSWAKKLGFNYEDTTKGLYLTPNHFEDTTVAVEALTEGDVDLIVVDSVPAMIPKSQLEGDIDEGGAIGEGSRLMAKFLTRITKTISDHGVALVFVNQMRAKINTGSTSRWEPKEQAAGGSALKFYGSLRIDMEKVQSDSDNTIEEVDMFSGRSVKVPWRGLHRAKAFKNKVAAPYRQCQFYIRYGKDGVYGIDNLQTLIDIAKAKGIIEFGGGGHYKYAGKDHNFAGRGTEELYAYLLHPDRAEVRKEIKASLGL